MQAPVLRAVREFPKIIRRNIGVTYPVYESDPIQQLFVEKLREYKKKSETGKIEMTAEMEKELKNDLSRIEKQYGAVGVDMTKFPKLEFKEPTYDSINLHKAT